MNIICIFGIIGSGDIWNKNEKRIEYINQKYGAVCEDMESISVYTASNMYNIPVVSIKGISNNEVLKEYYDDSVGMKLQMFIEKVVRIIFNEL